MAKNGSGRTRNFATVLYPESAPADWFDVLTELHIPAFISPLHDIDVNPTGEVKKEHYHVIIMFDSVKTTEQAIEVFQKIGGVGCERVNSVRGMLVIFATLIIRKKHSIKLKMFVVFAVPTSSARSIYRLMI